MQVKEKACKYSDSCIQKVNCENSLRKGIEICAKLKQFWYFSNLFKEIILQKTDSCRFLRLDDTHAARNVIFKARVVLFPVQKDAHV